MEVNNPQNLLTSCRHHPKFAATPPATDACNFPTPRWTTESTENNDQSSPIDSPLLAGLCWADGRVHFCARRNADALRRQVGHGLLLVHVVAKSVLEIVGKRMTGPEGYNGKGMRLDIILGKI
jgi:hypothetical protein